MPLVSEWYAARIGAAFAFNWHQLSIALFHDNYLKGVKGGAVNPAHCSVTP
jgi:hypothetical protein